MSLLRKHKLLLKAMSTLVLIYKLVCPLKSIHYFADYCSLVEQIVVTKSVSKVKTVHLVNFLLLCHTVHLIYTAIVPLDDLQRFLLYDASSLLLSYPPIDLFVSTNVVAAAYLSYSIFLNVDYRLLTFFQSVVIRRESSFFIWPTTAEGRSIPELVQRRFVLLLNLFMGLLTIVDCLFIFTTVSYCFKYAQYKNRLISEYSVTSLILLAVCHTVMGTLYWTFFLVVSHVTTLYFSMCCSLVHILLIKLRQDVAALKAVCRSANPLLQYEHFRLLHVTTWSVLFQANRSFGKLFLACLLAFCPISALLTILLTTDKIAPSQRPFIIGFILYQNIFVFAVHLLLTLCSQRLHATGRTLLRLMQLSSGRDCCQKRRKEIKKKKNQKESRKRHFFRIRLKLMGDIWAIVTGRKYGFTYGAYGLISLFAFTKYILLYGKALMLSRKMIQENRVLYSSSSSSVQH